MSNEATKTAEPTEPAEPTFQSDGSHGTCGTFADNIANRGFLPGAGLRGKAVYLWENTLDDDYLRLAKSWHKQQLDRKKYSNQKDQKCAVLTAEVSCKTSEVLDFGDRQLKTRIGALVKRLGIGTGSVSAISEGYDKAIQLYEKDNNVQVKVILSPVTGPAQTYCPYYDYGAMGSPGCIIARETGIVNNIKRLTDKEVGGLKI